MTKRIWLRGFFGLHRPPLIWQNLITKREGQITLKRKRSRKENRGRNFFGAASGLPGPAFTLTVWLCSRRLVRFGVVMVVLTHMHGFPSRHGNPWGDVIYISGGAALSEAGLSGKRTGCNRARPSHHTVRPQASGPGRPGPRPGAPELQDQVGSAWARRRRRGAPAAPTGPQPARRRVYAVRAGPTGRTEHH